MPGHIRQLVYLSDAAFGVGKKDIEEILAVSRRNNGRLGVTGMLMYSSGVFIQALEGEFETVGALYRTISDDRRHDNVETLVDRMLEHRDFADWDMGFVESPREELGRRIGIEGALDRDQALSTLGADETLASSLLRDFHGRLY